MPELLQPPVGQSYQTKQALVYHTLRDAIMQARLLPGERLVIDDIAKRLHVSTIPVREALQLLQSERLVEHKAHIGAVVTPIGPEAMHEVFALLEALESAVARAAVERVCPADIATLQSLAQAMEEESDHSRWIERNARFHRAISEIAAMPRAKEMLDRVAGDWERLRRWRFANAGVPDAAVSHREHRVMITALGARDAEGLEQVVRQHNRGALAYYLAHQPSA